MSKTSFQMKPIINISISIQIYKRGSIARQTGIFLYSFKESMTYKYTSFYTVKNPVKGLHVLVK